MSNEQCCYDNDKKTISLFTDNSSHGYDNTDNPIIFTKENFIETLLKVLENKVMTKKEIKNTLKKSYIANLNKKGFLLDLTTTERTLNKGLLKLHFGEDGKTIKSGSMIEVDGEILNLKNDYDVHAIYTCGKRIEDIDFSIGQKVIILVEIQKGIKKDDYYLISFILEECADIKYSNNKNGFYTKHNKRAIAKGIYRETADDGKIRILTDIEILNNQNSEKKTQ